jgi:hypothetical protein
MFWGVGAGGRGISIFNKLNNDLWCNMMKEENHFSTQKFATIHIVKTQDNQSINPIIRVATIHYWTLDAVVCSIHH